MLIFGSMSFVAEIVSVGYRLPFMRLPDPRCQPNHKSALENAAFVDDAIQELVTGHCVVQCEACSIVCSPLSVVTNKKGKQRLVLDLRYLNQFLPDRKFKYERLNRLFQHYFNRVSISRYLISNQATIVWTSTRSVGHT